MTTTTVTAPAPGPVPFDKLFAQSWTVFRNNWIIALPPLIAGAIMLAGIGIVIAAAVVIALAASTHQPNGGMIAALVLAYLVFLAVLTALFLWAYVAMFAMADAAWTTGKTTFADGFRAFRERAGATFLAWLGMMGLAIVALILAFPTLFVSLLAYPVFVMYVMPSVIVGRRGGFESIAESFRLVLRFFGGSALTALVLYAISYGISLIGAIAIVPLEFSVMPTGSDTAMHMPSIPLLFGSILGYVLAMLASIAYYGFVATVLVGMYRDLIAQPPPQPKPLPAYAAQIPPPVPPPAVPPPDAAPPAI